MWNLLSGVGVLVLIVLGTCYKVLRIVLNRRKEEFLYNERMARSPTGVMVHSQDTRITPRNRQRITIPRIIVSEPVEDREEIIRNISRYLEKPPDYEEPPSYDIAIQKPYKS